MILKVYRRSLGWNGPKLVQFARYCRQKYATVCRWYGDGQLNVLPAWHFILNAPLLGRPAVGMLQPFMGYEMRDFFLDFSDAALSALLESDAELREQVVFFCRRTLALAQHEGHCLDFVGRDNVTVLSDDRGRHELVILDYGLFELEAIERKAPATYERVVWRLERLEALLAMTEQRDVVEAKAAAGSRPQREARLD